jgi:hypothetical protein
MISLNSIINLVGDLVAKAVDAPQDLAMDPMSISIKAELIILGRKTKA